jgi:hypothetical protein
MWAYAYMKGWKSNENVEFDFHDAHDLRPLTDRALEETVRSRLRERFRNTKQVIVIVGESTRHLYKFVRWEIEMAHELDLPIVVVNLNGKREMDTTLCPPLLRGLYAVHVPFKASIIQYALDHFPDEYHARTRGSDGPRQYNDATYRNLDL